jgi:phospholipase C
MATTSRNIKHVFVLMLENRSLDHMLGFSGITGTDAVSQKKTKIEGLVGNESNGDFEVSQPADWSMPVDPCHEFPCLDHSPTNGEIAKWFILGLGFQNGTIFDRLSKASRKWHIYRGDEFPTSLALKGVHFLGNTSPLRHFKDQVQSTKHPYPYAHNIRRAVPVSRTSRTRGRSGFGKSRSPCGISGRGKRARVSVRGEKGGH